MGNVDERMGMEDDFCMLLKCSINKMEWEGREKDQSRASQRLSQ